MINNFIKIIFAAVLLSSFAYSAEVLAVVNGKNITSEVAPENFKELDKKTKELIVNRLIEKRLASDYALSTDIINTEEYKKSLEHVLQMSSKKENKTDKDNLANLFEKDASIEGYTTEQLNSKKGLLAFDFILNQKAEELKLSDQKMKEFYELNKYKYDTPASIELLTIVINDEKLAKDIIKQLDEAEDKLQVFSQLASKHSLVASGKNYGYFGKIPLNELNETLKKSLQNLKRNEFTKKAIKTEFGYEIFYVLNDIPEFNSTFESVKTTVEEELLKKEVKKWAMDKINELKKSANIEIKI